MDTNPIEILTSDTLTIGIVYIYWLKLGLIPLIIISIFHYFLCCSTYQPIFYRSVPTSNKVESILNKQENHELLNYMICWKSKQTFLCIFTGFRSFPVCSNPLITVNLTNRYIHVHVHVNLVFLNH